MTEKKDPPKTSNVKTIRKGITIDTTEAPTPVDKDVVDCLEVLLEEAKKGKVVGIVYTTANNDLTSDYNIVGNFDIPDRTQNMLKLLEEDFWEIVVRPTITGVFFESEE